MTRDLLPILLTAAAILATHATPLRAAGEDTTRMGSATGVTFSGYTKDAEGRRLWSLGADRANPLAGPEAGKNNWALKTVRIRIFDRNGRVALNVNAPDAKYFGDNKTAMENGPVSAEGDGLQIAGKGWRWTNGADKTDAITLESDVRVRITPPERDGEKRAPITITANRLHAVTDDDGDVSLTFEGDVRMLREKATLTCDKLSTRVRGAARAGAGKPGRDDIEVIDAQGSVRLVNTGMSLSGRTARMIPAENRVAIVGDAEFRDFANNRIRVTGSAMHYDQNTRRIRVEPTTDNRDSRVTAELPCLDERRAKDIRYADQRARVTGKNLEILIGDTGNTLFFTGDVRLADPDYTGTCERFTVESTRPTGRGPSEFMSVEPRGVVVTKVLADDNVTLMRDGRTLRCGHADISPAQGLVILTQSPRVDDPRNGSALAAARMSLDTSNANESVLIAYSGPEESVAVTLPPLRRANRPGVAAAKPTVVTADMLVATRRNDLGLFEFEKNVRLQGEDLVGSCERLGIEVNSSSTVRGVTTAGRIRRAVAVGDVKLKQDAYEAEAPRAELLPAARLREISVSEDNGLDGKEPLYVSLSVDPEIAPGRRPKIIAPETAVPSLDGKREAGAAVPNGKMSVEADYQDLIKGENRLRAFARGNVTLTGTNIAGSAAGTELVAIKSPLTNRFEVDTLVARGGVKLRFDERHASCDTLEILALRHRIILSGDPKIDGMPTPPGVVRKVISWTPGVGGALTALKVTDESVREGVAEVMRPRIEIPVKGAPDLGRSLKNLDKRK